MQALQILGELTHVQCCNLTYDRVQSQLALQLVFAMLACMMVAKLRS